MCSTGLQLAASEGGGRQRDQSSAAGGGEQVKELTGVRLDHSRAMTLAASASDQAVRQRRAFVR